MKSSEWMDGGGRYLINYLPYLDICSFQYLVIWIFWTSTCFSVLIFGYLLFGYTLFPQICLVVKILSRNVVILKVYLDIWALCWRKRTWVTGQSEDIWCHPDIWIFRILAYLDRCTDIWWYLDIWILRIFEYLDAWIFHDALMSEYLEYFNI